MRRLLAVCAVLLSAAAVALAAGEDRIVIPAKINGEPVRLAFDTGAQFHTLFRRTADRLGLKVTPPPEDAEVRPGLVKAGRAEPCQVDLGEHSTQMHFVVVDVPRPLQTQIDGVLSWRGYSSGIVAILWDDRQAGPVAEVPPQARRWLKAPLRSEEWMLGFTVAGEDGQERAVYIDTGSPSGVALSGRRWKQWLAEHPDAPATLEATYSPAHGLVVAEVRWADRLVFGPLVLPDVPIRKVEPAIERLYPACEAVLSLFALTRLDVVIDGKDQRIYLRPRADAKSVYDYNRLGAVFAPRNMKSQDLLAHVLELTPAHRAGIRSGDVLLRIDGLDATRWRTDPKVLPLSRFWARPAGTRLRLSLRRGGKPYEATVELRNILGARKAPRPEPDHL